MKGLILTITIITSFGCVAHLEHNYTRKNCEVINIQDGVATIEDKLGFKWKVQNEKLTVGDIVDLKMNDNCSDTYIHDDLIKGVVIKGKEMSK